MPPPLKREHHDSIIDDERRDISTSCDIDDYNQLVHDTTTSVELAARLQWELNRDDRQSPTSRSPTKSTTLVVPPNQQLEVCREILKEASKRMSLLLDFPQKKGKLRRVEAATDTLVGLRILQCIQIGLLTQ